MMDINVNLLQWFINNIWWCYLYVSANTRAYKYAIKVELCQSNVFWAQLHDS